jgi:hypothetical protein
MGFDKLISFFNKNFSNISEELFEVPHVVANHIYFDMNFLMYNSIHELEKEINKIIMIIFGVSYTDINIINSKLKIIFDKFHWGKLDIVMNDILDGDKIEDIIATFYKFLDENIIDLLCWHIYNTINHHIVNTHPIQFIKSINIFFDGIPTYSKIIEQRRRRVKNYLNSKNKKKLFNEYFKDIVNSIITEDDITYDYFDWINNMYSFDKSLGPYSALLIYLSEFINNKMTDAYKNIKIFVNSSTNYGESDYKIFKHIFDNNLDCSIAIHSCDSDFIFLITWYQLLSIVKYNDVNIMLINYNNYDENYNKSIYFGKKIINSILDKYSNINNIADEVSINIIFDFLSLLLLFGNDIMPPSYELGSELSIKHIFESHYQLYIDSSFVINLNNINIVNFVNLAKWLENIKNTNSFSIIILNRFYKMNYNNVLALVDKHKTLKEIANNINSNELIIQNKNFYLEDNSYQNLYNYIVYKSESILDIINLNRPFKIFFDDIKNANEEYIKITKNNNVEKYLKMFISINQLFFYNFNLYTSYNTIYYDDDIAPSIDMILQYIKMNDMNSLQKQTHELLKTFENNDNNDNLDSYFTVLSHHLFITPYIFDTPLFNNLGIKYIDSLFNVIDKNIDGLWLDINNLQNFNLKKIDPYKFIILCNSMIKFYQDNYVDRFLSDGKLLL